MKFVKMHGIGNDYVFIDCFKETIKDPVGLAKQVSDRHFGIGSDGLILIMPSERADARMMIFNADGSEAQMCGNGIRCVAKYIYDHGIVTKNVVSIETLAGIKRLELTVEDGKAKEIRVNMGKPILARHKIPMLGKGPEAINEPLTVNDKGFKITCVSMGNPHCIIFVDDVDKINLSHYGPLIENHSLFPERINVHFVQCLDKKSVKMKTWERGSGETLACGTGASAVCVAGVLNKKTDKAVLAYLPGGNLRLEWVNNEDVYMSGPATEVFKGEFMIGD